MSTYIKLLILPLALCSVVACTNPKAPTGTHSVRILNAKFLTHANLTQERDTAAFDRHWTAKRSVAAPVNPRWIYKLDVRRPGGASSRWLYDPSGYVVLLTKARTPVYQIDDVRSFNALISAQDGTATDVAPPQQ